MRPGGDDHADLIDRHRLRALRGAEENTDDDSFGRLIRSFVESAERTVEQMRRTLANRDARALAGLAHRLRGSAALFGAVRIAELCDVVKDRAEAGTPGDMAAMVAKLRRDLERTKSALERELA